MYKFETTGSFSVALEYLIRNTSQENLIMWDKLRGNDWYTGTKARQEADEFLEYERLKNKFEQ